jgi:uncharacterized protein YbjT (DUF2867 family)
VIVVTGASGAIGSALVERLLAEGDRPLLTGRRPEDLRRRFPDLEARRLDALDASTVAPALEGATVVYYLIHSMEPGVGGFAERDVVAARAVARAAREAGVERIVYLGGLGRERAALSHHLASRQETGDTLAADGPALVELRAAMVVGAASASFRMLADLVERLPAMVVPRWVDTPTQPIAIDDAVEYLAAARSIPLEGHRTVVEVGGADVLTYREMMLVYARLRGRRRLIVGVPFLTPRLSSLWCGLTTSVSSAVARPLIDGMVVPTVVTDDLHERLFPQIRPIGFDEALRRALAGR